MDKLRFFRSVSSWGHVLFAIMKVLSLLAAIFTFFGVLTLSFMPGGLVKVESTMKMDIRVEMIKLLGDDWKEIYKDFSLSDIGEGFDEGGVDEKGVTISQTAPMQEFENRAISLALIPVFVQMLLSFFLFRFISRMFKALKESEEPFRAPIQSDLQRTGWLVMALGTIPGLCVSLITFITDTQGLFQAEYDLFLVFAGFLFWALSDLLTHGKSLLPKENIPTYPQDPGDSASSGFDPNAF